jgi:hypothetical protein
MDRVGLFETTTSAAGGIVNDLSSYKQKALQERRIGSAKKHDSDRKGKESEKKKKGREKDKIG